MHENKKEKEQNKFKTEQLEQNSDRGNFRGKPMPQFDKTVKMLLFEQIRLFRAISPEKTLKK